jgi:AAA+ superfamily predicted ATPase
MNNIYNCDNYVRELSKYIATLMESSSLSFFGPSGTGKTMATEAVTNKAGKKIPRREA